MNWRIMWGRLVTAMKRAGSEPLPLKCWTHVLTGGVKKLPLPHSKVCLSLSSYQTVVAPRPLRM